ncbi:MAG: class II aldolase/adducin family protein [Bacteroidota bacterium]
MERLIRKYIDKLEVQGICDAGDALMGGVDADIVWSREGTEIPVLKEVLQALPINSILYSQPAEPYRSLINFLANHSCDEENVIRPEDTETRTFLHDIPVVDSLDAKQIIEKLKKRKTVIIKNHGLISFGIVSPEQAFITYSSVCFSCFVKFFVDYYFKKLTKQPISEEEQSILQQAIQMYGNFISSFSNTPTFKGPFMESETIIRAMAEAGRLTIASRMVDSFFGNISYKSDDTLFISQTGSSMDELEGYIDPCPTDNSATIAITASSEYTAHKSIYALCDSKAILHGHPKFSVILSMMCEKTDCETKGKCHIHCKEKRMIEDIQVVPGEVGTGPTGLSNTLPPALKDHRGVIVYGHGLFTKGKVDFNDAFATLVDVERMCYEKYLEIIN